MSENPYLKATRQWVEKFVIGLNLCPFARHPFQQGRIRFVLSEAQDENQLVRDLLTEFLFLYDAEPSVWETSLLVHPHCLKKWEDYWDFLEIAEELLDEAGLTGVFQLVGFHPDYLFGEEDPADASHYTNRSPFPLIHILREESISQAVDTHPDIDKIPVENVKKLRELGKSILEKKLENLKN